MTLKISPYNRDTYDPQLAELVRVAAERMAAGTEDHDLNLVGRVMSYISACSPPMANYYLAVMAETWLARQPKVSQDMSQDRPPGDDERTLEAVRELQAAQRRRLERDRPDVAKAHDEALARAVHQYARVADSRLALDFIRERIFSPKQIKPTGSTEG